MAQQKEAVVLVHTPDDTVIVRRRLVRGKQSASSLFHFSSRNDIQQEIICGLQSLLGVEIKVSQIKYIGDRAGMMMSSARGSRKIALVHIKLSKSQYKKFYNRSAGEGAIILDEVYMYTRDLKKICFLRLPDFALAWWHAASFW